MAQSKPNAWPGSVYHELSERVGIKINRTGQVVWVYNYTVCTLTHYSVTFTVWLLDKVMKHPFYKTHRVCYKGNSSTPSHISCYTL